MTFDPDPSLTAASLAAPCSVPPLSEPDRFELAVYGALGAWWEYDHALGLHDHHPSRIMPAPISNDALFLTLFDGGLERWRHIRAKFDEWYSHAGPQSEREAATHRFLAVVELIDFADPDLAAWIWPEPPLRVRTPLLTAAAQASLFLLCSCLDNPVDECSILDREDLLARVQVAAEQEQVDRGFYHALAALPEPDL